MNKKTEEQQVSEFEERVVFVNRCSKTVKGGRRLSFSALVVVGKSDEENNERSYLGIGFAKAKEPADAIRKASKKAKEKRFLLSVHLAKMEEDSSANTIPHSIKRKKGGSQVFLKPVPEGTGICAGPVPRMIVEVCGIDDVLVNLEGSNNRCNQAYAMVEALTSLRSKKDLMNARKREVKE